MRKHASYSIFLEYLFLDQRHSSGFIRKCIEHQRSWTGDTGFFFEVSILLLISIGLYSALLDSGSALHEIKVKSNRLLSDGGQGVV
jgi:hypothetical protein